MKRTTNLNLPIYDNPDSDIFDIQEWNHANNLIDGMYKEFKDISKEVVSLNANAEIIVARKGENTLGDKISKIDLTIFELKDFLNFMPVNGGEFSEIDGNSNNDVSLDGGVF